MSLHIIPYPCQAMLQHFLFEPSIPEWSQMCGIQILAQVTAMGLLFSVLSRVKTNDWIGYVELVAWILPDGGGLPYSNPLDSCVPWILNWSRSPNGELCHPVSNLPRFFSLSSPKDPTHCNAAGPQLKSCWREAGGRKTHSFPKDFIQISRSSPLRREQHSPPSFHKLSPSYEGLHSTCRTPRFWEKSTFLVCERVNQEFFTPKIPRSPRAKWVFRFALQISHGLTFLCSQCSHLLANGLKACSPLGPRLQCLTSVHRWWQEFQGDSKIIDQYGSSIVYYKYIQIPRKKTNSNSLAVHLNKLIPMLSLLL